MTWVNFRCVWNWLLGAEFEVYVRGDLNTKEQEKLFTKMKAATSKERRKKYISTLFFFFFFGIGKCFSGNRRLYTYLRPLSNDKSSSRALFPLSVLLQVNTNLYVGTTLPNFITVFSLTN